MSRNPDKQQGSNPRYQIRPAATACPTCLWIWSFASSHAGLVTRLFVFASCNFEFATLLTTYFPGALLLLVLHGLLSGWFQAQLAQMLVLGHHTWGHENETGRVAVASSHCFIRHFDRHFLFFRFIAILPILPLSVPKMSGSQRKKTQKAQGLGILMGYLHTPYAADNYEHFAETPLYLWVCISVIATPRHVIDFSWAWCGPLYFFGIFELASLMISCVWWDRHDHNVWCSAMCRSDQVQFGQNWAAWRELASEGSPLLPAEWVD